MGLHHASRGALVFAAVSALSAAYAQADVVYRETFGHNVAGTSDPGPATFDWAIHSSATGLWRNVAAGVTTQANVNASGGRSLTIYNSGSGVAQAGCNSRDDDMLNINAGEPTAYLCDTIDDGIAQNNVNPRGNAYVSGTAWGANSADRRALYWTPEFTLNPANYAPGSIKFSWYQGNQNILDPMHLSIRIGSQWFVQTAGITNQSSVTLANFFSNAELKEVPFSTAAAGWSALNFDGTYDIVTDQGTNSSDPGAGGAGLSIGTPLASDLPAGPITAFGLLSNDPQTTGAGNRRFDAFTISATPLVVAGPSSWNVDADGNWSAAGNWTPGVPNAVDATANFGTITTAPRLVTVDSAQTVGTMNFSSPNSYTISGATVTLDVSTGQAAINVTAGTHTINAALNLADNTTITSAAGTGVAIGELFATGKNITKAGAGSVSFRNVRAAALNVTAGSARIRANAGPNLPIGTSVVQSLTIATGASLDLSNNSAIVDYTGAVGTLVSDVRQHMQTGRLTSGNADSTHRLGYGDNAVLNKPSFGGQTVDTSSLLIKFTYGGDSNLDGQVDVTDLGSLATNWQTSNVWTGGDFNYDGFVDVSDLGILATDWQLGVGSPLGPGSLDAAMASVGLGGVAVPEPASIGWVVIGLASIVARRRR